MVTKPFRYLRSLEEGGQPVLELTAAVPFYTGESGADAAYYLGLVRIVKLLDSKSDLACLDSFYTRIGCPEGDLADVWS